jgi:transposase
MHIRVTSSGGRSYVQLAESYRNEDGKPRSRVVATLGRLDQLDSKLDSVIKGLLKVTGRGQSIQEAPEVEFESARSFGDLWALTAIWEQLGLDQLRKVFGKGRHGFDIEAVIRVMVFNRLCDPESKLGILRWLKGVAFPGIDVSEIGHQHLLRAMDVWDDCEQALLDKLGSLLQPLIDQELSVVFYDMTTISTEGLTQLKDDVRAHGRSKSGLVDRQFMLGLVQTSDGLPIAYEVLPGNTSETTTLAPMIERLIKRYPIKRVVLVADRGLLSMDNLAKLKAQPMPHGSPLEFIMAVPAARYSEFAKLMDPMHAAQPADKSWIAESAWEDLRLVVAHDPAVAAERTRRRRDKIAELETMAQTWTGKLDEQDGGKRTRGRKLSDSGAKARFYHEVQEGKLGSVIKVDLKSELFSWHIQKTVLERLEQLDGKLVILTNVTDLDSEQVVTRYKSLADIERGFRVLKSEIEIGPVYHRLPQRIRAHAGICFLALVMHRVMRMRLKANHSDLSPDRTLELLRTIQRHRVKLNGVKPVEGISTVSTEYRKIFSDIEVAAPTKNVQLSLF